MSEDAAHTVVMVFASPLRVTVTAFVRAQHCAPPPENKGVLCEAGCEGEPFVAPADGTLEVGRAEFVQPRGAALQLHHLCGH